MKRGAFAGAVIVFLVLLSAAAFAQGFSTSVNPVKDSIKVNEQAEYEITITNNEPYDETIRIRAPEIFWSVQSKPLRDYFSGVEIPARESKAITLLVSPIQPIPVGQYLVEIEMEGLNSGQKITQSLTLSIRPPVPEVKEYIPTVVKTVDMPVKIDPRNPIPIKITLSNRNPRTINDLQIDGSSSHLKATVLTDLGPLKRNVISRNLSLGPMTPPEKGTMTWSFTMDSRDPDKAQKLLPDIKVNYEIIGYSDIVEGKRETTSQFLKTVYEVPFANKGNTIAYKTYEKKTDPFPQLFTSTEPKPYVINKPEGTYYSWDIALKPGEKVTVRVTENYRPLFYALVLALLLTVLYYVFRSPVSIRKEAAVIGYEEEGITDIKIILHAKNRGSKGYDRLSVADRVPVIANIAKESEIGSLKPSKTMQTREGTVIRWELDKLEKSEERVFSYTIKSKLSILGKFSLPAASAKFYDGMKERKTSSNSPRVRS